MMNRVKSTTTQLLKFLVIGPVLLVTCIFCRRAKDEAKAEGPITLQSESAIVIKSDPNKWKPIMYVDGVKQPADFDINTIKSEDISSISVWKDKVAIEKFGDAGKNGVLEITLKKKK